MTMSSSHPFSGKDAVRRNSYATSTQLLLSCGAVILALIITLYIVSWYNTCVSLEKATVAQWRQNQNAYSSFVNKVAQATGVTQEYQKQFSAILRDTMEGRYGTQGGVGRALAFVQEHNPTIDVRMYAQLAALVEAGRNDFAREQQSLLDRQRSYGTHLGAAGGGLLGQICGFPHSLQGADAPPSDRDGDGRLTALDYPIVLSSVATKAFETGVDEPAKPFAP